MSQSTQTTITETNYLILTPQQFVNAYPSRKLLPDGSADDNERVLVLHDDDNNLLTALWGTVNDFITFTADLAKYTASNPPT